MSLGLLKTQFSEMMQNQFLKNVVSLIDSRFLYHLSAVVDGFFFTVTCISVFVMTSTCASHLSCNPTVLVELPGIALVTPHS